MQSILNHLFEYKKLSRQQSLEIMLNMARGKYNQAELAAFLSVYLMRPVSVDELLGFRDALLELCTAPDLGGNDFIDLCGTGGDGKNTFNISTLASFIVAGAGYKVVKHGNYGVTSGCGSSNLLEYLGYAFSTNSGVLNRELDRANICFLHAPLFHPAMKNIAPVRKDLRIKTFFNILGPLVNPVQPKKQIVGVYELKIARLYQFLLQKEYKTFSVLFNLDGYDEISLTDSFKWISNQGERIMKPEDMGFVKIKPEDIHGGSGVKDSARIFLNILEGKGTEAQNSVAVANAAIAIKTYTGNNMQMSLAEAKESLLSGRAFEALKKLLEHS